MRDLVNVEAIPFEVLNAGITWDWENVPAVHGRGSKRKPSLNLAFMAPLTPFRPLRDGGGVDGARRDH